MMSEDQNKNEIEELKKFIANVEESLESAKAALSKLTGEEFKRGGRQNTFETNGLSVTENGTVIEGFFNGENMVGPDNKIFPVPANYASKSKLIEGDQLKLTIAEDGSFIFKQIGPAARKKVIGTLNFEDNMYHVSAEGKGYNVLYASVTYFKAKPGDRVTIVVPAEIDSKWGALENVIHEMPASDEPAVQSQATNPSTPITPGVQIPVSEEIAIKPPELTEEPAVSPDVITKDTAMTDTGEPPSIDELEI